MINNIVKYWHAHLAWVSTLAVILWPHARIFIAHAVAASPRLSVFVASAAVFLAGISPSPMSRN